MPEVTAVCLSTTIQRTLTFSEVKIDHVNRSQHYVANASGKAVNTARVLNQLEKDFCQVVCPIGVNNKELFFQLKEKEPYKIITVEIPGNTRECWTLLDRKNSTTTEVIAGEPAIQADMSEYTLQLMQKIEESLEQTNALLLAGSKPEIWPKDLAARICALASKMRKTVMCDFWGDDLTETLQLCTPEIVKINEEEFCRTFGYAFPQPEEELAQLIAQQSLKFGNIFVITRGKDTTFAADNGKIYKAAIMQVKPVNTTGCGDSFSAGFLYSYMKDKNMEKALQQGTECAAKNAENELPGSIC